jgi:hypothetical protein
MSIAVPEFVVDDDQPDGEELDANKEIEEQDKKSAFGRVLVQQSWGPLSRKNDLNHFLHYLCIKLDRRFKKLLKVYTSIKANVTVTVDYSKVNDPTATVVTGHLKSTNQVITEAAEIPEYLDKLAKTIVERNSNFIREKSGLVIREVMSAMLKVAKHDPLAGLCGADMKVPSHIALKKGVVSVQNIDKRCFGFAVVSALEPAKDNADRPAQYEVHFAKYGLDQIEYPVAPEQVPALEDKLKIAINVFTVRDDEGKSQCPLYVSKKVFKNADETEKKTIDLLFWTRRGHEEGHFAWIKSFSRFMADLRKSRHKLYWCKRCLGHFTTPEALTNHQEYCERPDFCHQIFVMPEEGAKLKFKSHRNAEPAVGRIYLDYECKLEKLDETTHSHRNINTTKYQQHVPYSAGLHFVTEIPELQDIAGYQHHQGDDAVEWSLRTINKIYSKYYEHLHDKKRLRMTHADWVSFRAAQHCYICSKPFDPRKKSDKCRDHNHVTGNYRGAAHKQCNIQQQQQYNLPVFAHNFTGYDSHLICQAKAILPNRPVQVIGTMEKYKQMKWGRGITFKDSLAFFGQGGSSLDQLCKNLVTAGKENFVELGKEFEGEQFDLATSKGVFCYDYMDSDAKFNERQLPPREAFFNKLKNEECSEENYARAQAIWDKFDCHTMLDYHDVYLKTDVLILADIFENHRKMCMNHYGLDPAHYMSAPQLSWDAMLKMTGVELELTHDPEQFRMIDNGIRGGVCMISKRFARANNPMLGPKYYDPSKPTTYIIYWDANNLYGWSMSQMLPTGGFEWVPEAVFSQIDWKAQTKTQPIGYNILCDINMPPHLHDRWNDYPLAPDRVHINATMLSEKQMDVRQNYNLPRSAEATKLIPSLLPRRNYLCDYRNLKFYLEEGAELIKIHKVLKFNQAPWLKQYIDKNSELRKQAKNEAEKNLFKLKNNSVYGKTVENLKKRSDVRFVTNMKDCLKLTQKVQCKDWRIFNENAAAVELIKVKQVIDKPFYVGFTVLELSKLLMYEFHYNVIKAKYGDKAQLLFTDTDSLMYEIETENVYEDMKQMGDHFDCSGYPTDSPYFDVRNKTVVGKFKDETNFVPILEFVGLKPKMYSFLTINDVESDNPIVKHKHRAKGISSAASLKLRHEDFKAQLDLPRENALTNRRIGHTLHKLYTLQVEKRGLCAFDDKRFVLADGIHTLSYGHKDITRNVVDDEVRDPAPDVIFSHREARRKRKDQLLEKRKIAFARRSHPEQQHQQPAQPHQQPQSQSDQPLSPRAFNPMVCRHCQNDDTVDGECQCRFGQSSRDPVRHALPRPTTRPTPSKRARITDDDEEVKVARTPPPRSTSLAFAPIFIDLTDD